MRTNFADAVDHCLQESSPEYVEKYKEYKKELPRPAEKFAEFVCDFHMELFFNKYNEEHI